MNNQKWSFIDLDGTLLNFFKRVSLKNLKALKNYSIQNNKIIITTGRWPVSGLKFNKKIEDFTKQKNNYLISLNGAYIKDLTTDQIIFKKIIPFTLFEQIIEILKEFNAKSWIYTYEGIKQKKIFSLNQSFKKIIGILNHGSVIKLKLNNLKNDEVYKITIWKFNIKTIDNLYKKLNNFFQNKLTIIRTSNRVIEITAENINKGQALEFIKNENNLKKYQICTFGDSNNDYSMFLKAGFRFNFKKSNKLLSEISNFSYKSNKSFSKAVIFLTTNNLFKYKQYSKSINLEIDKIEANNQNIPIYKFLFLWSYLVYNNKLTLNVKDCPYWLVKTFLFELINNFNIDVKINNKNALYSEKEKKFIFAKSFSDTQKQAIFSFIEKNKNKIKLFIVEGLENISIFYQNKTILNFFLNKFTNKNIFFKMFNFLEFNLANFEESILSVTFYSFNEVNELNSDFEIKNQDELTFIFKHELTNEKIADLNNNSTLSIKIQNNKNFFDEVNNHIKQNY